MAFFQCSWSPWAFSSRSEAALEANLERPSANSYLMREAISMQSEAALVANLERPSANSYQKPSSLDSRCGKLARYVLFSCDASHRTTSESVEDGRAHQGSSGVISGGTHLYVRE
jgi:hypothetical protein